MNRLASLLCAAALLAAAPWLIAAENGVQFSGRIGPSIGTYEAKDFLRVEDPATGGSLSRRRGGKNEFVYGVQTGLSAHTTRFFADLGLDYTRLKFEGDELDRTDLLFTAGFKPGAGTSLYGGYRISSSGDGLFNDDTFKEYGFFAGAGIGDIAAGALILGASAAYNFSEIEDYLAEGRGFDYRGFSIKLGAALRSAPGHSLQLRYQKFEGDDDRVEARSVDDVPVVVDFELEETYLQLYYLYSFAL